MSERTDHVIDTNNSIANALHLAGEEEATSITHAMVANASATLALVEQQRIANLITVAGWVADSRAEDVGFDLDKLRVGVAGEVWDALGLIAGEA